MRQFIKSENGAVTIFLLLIFLAVFFFSGVLIDLGRIMAAKKELQSATHAGVRSVLSQYNEGVNDYGLFCVDLNEDEMNTAFNQIVNKNLSSNMKDDSYFAIIDTEIIDSNIIQLANLGDLDWFEYQIMEEMKYKALVEGGKTVAKALEGLTKFFEVAINVFNEEELDIEEDFIDSEDDENIVGVRERVKDEYSDYGTDLIEEYDIRKVTDPTDFFNSFADKYQYNQDFYNRLKPNYEHITQEETTFEMPNLLKNLSKVMGILTGSFFLKSAITKGYEICKKLTLIADNSQEFFNEMCVNEYALLYFTCLSDSDNLLKTGEVEFIYNGSFSPYENTMTMITNIFGTRFLIRAIEAFVFTPGELIVKTVAAIIYGLPMGVLDTVKLFNGKTVNFLPEIKGLKLDLKVSYKDYVRILLLTVDKKTKLHRMEALIETKVASNDGKVMAQAVYVKGRTQASVKLLFLPTVIKALNLVGVMEDRLTGDKQARYIISAEAASYY